VGGPGAAPHGRSRGGLSSSSTGELPRS
jgi:hypothetical protein